jgi:hypothetical protein
LCQLPRKIRMSLRQESLGKEEEPRTRKPFIGTPRVARIPPGRAWPVAGSESCARCGDQVLSVDRVFRGLGGDCPREREGDHRGQLAPFADPPRHRCLPLRRPSGARSGPERESGLVDEDDLRLLAPSVFRVTDAVAAFDQFPDASQGPALGLASGLERPVPERLQEAVVREAAPWHPASRPHARENHRPRPARRRCAPIHLTQFPHGGLRPFLRPPRRPAPLRTQ